MRRRAAAITLAIAVRGSSSSTQRPRTRMPARAETRPHRSHRSGGPRQVFDVNSNDLICVFNQRIEMTTLTRSDTRPRGQAHRREDPPWTRSVSFSPSLPERRRSLGRQTSLRMTRWLPRSTTFRQSFVHHVRGPYLRRARGPQARQLAECRRGGEDVCRSWDSSARPIFPRERETRRKLTRTSAPQSNEPSCASRAGDRYRCAVAIGSTASGRCPRRKYRALPPRSESSSRRRHSNGATAPDTHRACATVGPCLSGAARSFLRSRMPMISSHSVITVGPKIVKILDAVEGSATSAWIRPAPIEATPATTTTQPSHLG